MTSTTAAQTAFFTARTSFLAAAGAVSTFGFADLAPETGTLTLTPMNFLSKDVAFSSVDTRAAARSFFTTADPVIFLNIFGVDG
ncbi:MAG: hypothetical protein SNJ63_03775 [Sphingomonadaceae bacterium]